MPTFPIAGTTSASTVPPTIRHRAIRLLEAVSGWRVKPPVHQGKRPVAEPAVVRTSRGIDVKIVRSHRARRYLLRWQEDGVARLVIPRRGSRAEALGFLERNEDWMHARFRDWTARCANRSSWKDGASILWRGEHVRFAVDETSTPARFHFGDQSGSVPAGQDVRTAVHAHMRAVAARELPARTRELARHHGIDIKCVTVRAQKTRWGSCSARGTISLNWRLLQAPASVQDYLIVHELMHRRQMNHSGRFWKLVEEACPDYRGAERWLKQTRLTEMD